MNKKEFTSLIKSEVEVQTHCKVQIKETIKNNGHTLTGLLIQEEGCNIIPTIYLERYYEEYESGEEISNLVEQIIRAYNQNKIVKNEDISFFQDFQKVKERIRYKLINYEANKQLLQQIPHTKVLDLAKVYYVPVELGGISEFGSILIQNTHIHLWKVTDEEVKKAAEKNTPKQLPVQIEAMDKIIMQLLQIQNNTEEQELFQQLISERKTAPMYVISNTQKLYGATVMCYENVLKNVAEVIGTDLFILPSSLHELIVISRENSMEPKELREMVETINQTEVDIEERLSDNVYIYHKLTNTIEII